MNSSALNSAGKSSQYSSKKANKYLKMVFSDAAIHTLQYYPVIKKHYNTLLRKRNKQITKTIIAKEMAKIVYHVLKKKENFNNRFKGKELEHTQSLQWPRVMQRHLFGINPYA